MNRSPLESSHVISVGYDPNSQRMHVEFHNGALFEYDAVTPEMHRALVNHVSPGSFFAANFRKGYNARRIN